MSSTAKQVWTIFSCIFLTFLFLVCNFVPLAILAPAMISAASTISVICGFAMIAVVVIFDIALAIVIVRRFYNLNPEKENS